MKERLNQGKGEWLWESPLCVYMLDVHTCHNACVEVRWQLQVPFLTFFLMYAAAYGKLTGSWRFRNSSISTSHLAAQPLSSQICASMSTCTWFLGVLALVSMLAWQQLILLSCLLNTDQVFLILPIFFLLIAVRKEGFLHGYKKTKEKMVINKTTPKQWQQQRHTREGLQPQLLCMKSGNLSIRWMGEIEGKCHWRAWAFSAFIKGPHLEKLVNRKVDSSELEP